MTSASALSTRRVPFTIFALEREGLKHPPPGGHSGGSHSDGPCLRWCCHVHALFIEASCGRRRGNSRVALRICTHGKAYFAVAGRSDLLKSGGLFSRNADIASLASADRTRSRTLRSRRASPARAARAGSASAIFCWLAAHQPASRPVARRLPWRLPAVLGQARLGSQSRAPRPASRRNRVLLLWTVQLDPQDASGSFGKDFTHRPPPVVTTSGCLTRDGTARGSPRFRWH